MASPQDGSSAVVAQNQLNSLTQEDSSKNRVPTGVFDPKLSSQDKRAAAGKARDRGNTPIDPVSKEVAMDSGKGNTIPTTEAKNAAVPGSEGLPGDMPLGPSPEIPQWYEEGWRGLSAPPPAENGEDKTILDTFLTDQFYGSWYHNAGLIVFAVFASHFLTRFHFGFGWLIIVLAICNTYYTTSMARLRRRARDDIQRELVKTRLVTEHETADWINNFLDRFWIKFERFLAETIISSVDQVLSTNTPPFLESLQLTDFNLGSKAPRIDLVRTFPNTPDDMIIMDWAVSFTPNDLSDMRPSQIQSKSNPRIELSVRFGKGLATATMTILVEDLSFTGNMQIRIQLTDGFPHIQFVDISFTTPPDIDFSLKPIGGDKFGVDINHIPGLSDFIRKMTDANLQPLLYTPNYFRLNLEQLLSGAPQDTAIGVLQVNVQSARSIKGTKLGGGTPDPYVGLSISHRKQLACTKYKLHTFNPTWMETKFLIISSLADPLVLSVYDYNEFLKDTPLGSTTFELDKLRVDANQEGIESPILKDGKNKGMLRYGVSFYRVLKPRMVNGKNELPETTVGIVRLTIHQAKELDANISMTGELNPFAKVLVGNNPVPVLTSSIAKHTNNPVWDAPIEFICADKTSSVVTVKIIDDREFLKDPLVGYISTRVEDLLESTAGSGRDWWPLSGCQTGRLRMSAEWKPLDLPGLLEGANRYTPPIGVVRFFVEKALDVKNVEATLGGKSDPYVRVQIDNIIKGRTEVVNNNLNPRWDQFIYVPVHSLKDTLVLECMDYQSLTKDRSLGTVELDVCDLAQRSDDKQYPYQSTGIRNAADPIRLDSGNAFKGTLHYTAEFLPALALKGIKFEAQPNELQQAVESDEGGDVEVILDDTPPIPPGITARSPIVEPMVGEPDTPPKSSENSEASSIHTPKSTIVEPTHELTEMSLEELLHHQSGILIINVISGQLAKKSRLEVLLDEGYWPAFATAKSRSTSARWDHVGEGFVKELDVSKIWLRLDESTNDDKDDIIAEWKGDAKAFLKSTLDGPHKFTLVHSEDNTTSTIEIESRYVPVPVKLDPRESVNNQGTLRVDLLDGRDITGVDRGGKSDPFAVFYLDGHKVYKSQTKKKTLEPEWKENFEVCVHSRVGADFSVEIFDWNQMEQAKSLGSAKINIEDLEPLEGTERTLHLTSPKHGEKGQVRIRLVFQPEIIAKSRKPTSTFSTVMGEIGGKNVLSGVTGVFKKEKDIFRKTEGETVPPVPDLPAEQKPHVVTHTGATSSSAAPAKDSNGQATNDPGSLKVTVLDAKGLVMSDIKPYVVLRVGAIEHKTKHAGKSAAPEWNECFTFLAGSTTPKLTASLFDHKTLAKDKLLGEADIDLWKHLKLEATSSADVVMELREGHGQLQVRLEFDADSNPLGRRSSSISVNRNQLPASPSRFTIRGRRPGGADHDD